MVIALRNLINKIESIRSNIKLEFYSMFKSDQSTSLRLEVILFVVSDCRTSLNKLNTCTTPITLKLNKFNWNLTCKTKSSTAAMKTMWTVIAWI